MASNILEDKPESLPPGVLDTRPYKPSWVDRFMAAVERLPGPYWLIYLVLFGVEVGILHLVVWADGGMQRFQFESYTLILPIWLWGCLAIMTYLDRVALKSLREFRPLLEINDTAQRRLEYQFTTMPSSPVIKSGLFWSAVYVIMVYFITPTMQQAYSLGSVAMGVWIVTGLISFFAGSAIYYHTIRQLRLVNQTVRAVGHFNLFRLDPAYAFSRLTARTSIVWVLLVTSTLVLGRIPASLLSLMVAFYAVQITLALAAFALPIWSVHQCLVSEKRRLIAEHNLHVEATLQQLHRHVDEGDLGSTAGAGTALAGLAAEKDVLAKIPTWPWRTGTLAAILSALALPIILFLIQVALSRWLGL